MIVSIDSQILNNLQACPRKLKYYNIENWRPKHKAAALSRGWLLHELLRSYYQALKDKKDFNVAIQEATQAGYFCLAQTNLELPDADLVFHAFNEYVLLWRYDGWEPLDIEQTFAFEMYQDDSLQVIYKGIIDLIVTAPQIGLLAIDHKSSMRNSKIHPLSNQFLGYCKALGINNFIVNKVGFQKTLKPEDKMVRELLSYSQPVIDEWSENVVNWVRQLIIYKQAEFFPPNFTSCDKYGGCLFSQICFTTPDARDWKLKVEFERGEEWDPMKRDEE